MQQLVAWRYLFQSVVYELAGVTFVHKSLLLCGPARFSKNAPSVREVGSFARWVETQMPLKATVTLSLSPTHHCPKHIAWLYSTSYLSYRGWGKTGNKYLLNDEPNIQYHLFSKPRFQLSHWFYASHNILLVDSFFTEVNQHQLLSLETKTCHWSTEGSVGQIGEKVESPRMQLSDSEKKHWETVCTRRLDK